MRVEIVIMGNSVCTFLEQRFEIALSKLLPSSRKSSLRESKNLRDLQGLTCLSGMDPARGKL